MDYRMLRLAFGIADSTISRIRNVHRSCFESYLIDHPVMLGGPGVIVELDETVLCRRRVIRIPTNEDDEIANTVWIIGGIDRTDARNFFIQVIPNRQIGHMLAAVRHRIAPGSILVTDGHPSYPAVASELEMEHRSVNHSVGFTTLDGVHSNNIEAFWSHLKATMRKEFGIRRENLVMWLLEYTFRRRFIQDASPQEFEAIFISILIEFFE